MNQIPLMAKLVGLSSEAPKFPAMWKKQTARRKNSSDLQRKAEVQDRLLSLSCSALDQGCQIEQTKIQDKAQLNLRIRQRILF